MQKDWVGWLVGGWLGSWVVGPLGCAGRKVLGKVDAS